MNRSVKPGSSPSRPRKITRWIFACRNPCFLCRTAHPVRKGQTRNEPAVKSNEISRLRNDPRNAKPAPGPMYARMGGIINVQVTTFADLRWEVAHAPGVPRSQSCERVLRPERRLSPQGAKDQAPRGLRSQDFECGP